MHLAHHLCGAAFAVVASFAAAQSPSRGGFREGAADAYATESGGVLLDIPGVGADFVLFADGAFEERPDGTARLSAHLHQLSVIDRELHLVLELTGKLTPTDPGYPPIGMPVVTLQPGAYVPIGPIDPAAFTYYTAGTGSLTGLRAFDGARIDVALAQPMQLGAGASNKNVLDGLAADLLLTVVQPPLGGFAPTGPALLRADLRAATTACHSNADGNLAQSGNQDRHAFQLGGIGDYLFVPAGTWSEDAAGNATLQVELRAAADFADAWAMTLTLGGRVLPGALAYPPGTGPLLELLSTEYAAQGGPIDPAQWRYYTTASGTLTGLGSNAGGSLQLATGGAFQVGLGAAGANRFFGVAGSLGVTLLQSPNNQTLLPTGTAELRANLSSDCLLPAMLVTSTTTPANPSVTTQRLQLTGIDIGFCEQIAIGPRILGNDPHAWNDGYFVCTSATSLEVWVPPGLPPGQYPMLLIHRSGTSNQLWLDVQPPPVPALATEPTRAIGEDQHWVAHQGNLVGFTFCFFVVSFSNQPSDIPVFVTLQLGAMWTDFLLLDTTITDMASGVTRTQATIPAWFQGTRLYAQAAFMDSGIYHLYETNLVFTDY